MSRPQRILAVASGGGHWVELMRIRPALEGGETTYVTVRREYARDVPDARFFVVNDATRWNKIALLMMAAKLLYIIVRVRPDVVITTGAAHGYFALRFGKWLKARTVWLDSIANGEELSMSGRITGRFADLWLTQWEHLATPDGPEYAGAVM